jgi:hypothetical protein
MPVKFFSYILLVCGLALSCESASAGCDASFNEQYQASARIVDSLRPDKGGQARVFAVDGSEFTAGQVRWLQGELREIEEACVRGDQARAGQLLAGVRELLQSHHRGGQT